MHRRFQRRNRFAPCLAGVFAVGVATVLAGCGQSDQPELGEVAGLVTLDGKPLPGAMVQFQPEKGRSSYGETGPDGRYEMTYLPGEKGAVLGAHTVRITTSQELSAVQTQPDSGGTGIESLSVTRLTPETVPPRYNLESTLREEVSAGANSIDIELKTEP